MEFGCDLEIDVNGEMIFVVNKEILSSFSGRFNKMFSRLTSSSGQLKVVFHNFPGGACGFELFARFCYNNGLIDLTPSNLILLSSVAHFMEIGSNSMPGINLVNQIEKSFEQISSWTWSEILIALGQCQDLLPAIYPPFLLERVLDCLVGRLALPLPLIASPVCRPSDNSSYQSSSDTSTSSSTTTRVNCSPTTWWLDDLLFLNANTFEKVIRMMVSHKLHQSAIFKFLVSYLSWKCLGASQSMKCKTINLAFKLLPLLDRKCLSCKSLFDVLRLISSLKKINKHHKLRLEEFIGSMLDQATLDHLLVPSPSGKRYKYDVGLVLRLVNAFLLGNWMYPTRLKIVACLIDSYAVEVAPDKFLKPSMFLALVTALPDSAREISDKLHQAIDIYFKVHLQLSEEEKMRICCSSNPEISKVNRIDQSYFTHPQASKFIPFRSKADEDANMQGSDERISHQ